jgi:hypothetical protein
MRPIHIEKGLRFVRVLRHPINAPVFEVKSILVENVPAPHAVLVNTRDPLWTRTLACSALINNPDYDLVKARAEHPTE